MFIITYVSSSARGLIICRHPRLDHAKQNLVIYGGSFSGQETSLVTIFDGCSMLEKKNNLYSISDLDHGLQNKSKFRAISE